MYQIGEYLVKANKGVCRVSGIVHPDFADSPVDVLYYYLESVEAGGGTYYIPVEGAETSLRAVISEEEALALIRSAASIESVWIENDKKREQTYKEVLRSNDPALLIGMIKSMQDRRLERIRKGKKNTAVDERYSKMAENALFAELSAALHQTKEEVRELLRNSLESEEQRNGQTG